MRFKRTRDQARAVWLQVQQYRETHPDASWRELHRAVPNHYRTAESMRGSIQQIEREAWEDADTEDVCLGVCCQCQNSGSMVRFRQQLWCATCLNPADAPADAVAWIAQRPQASNLAQATIYALNDADEFVAHVKRGASRAHLRPRIRGERAMHFIRPAEASTLAKVDR